MRRGLRVLAAACLAVGVRRAQAEVPVVTPHEAYVGKIKVYNVGIMEDPVKGTKRGKGSPALNSSYWVKDLAKFVAEHIGELKAILTHAKALGEVQQGADFVFLINQANALFMRAENGGLKSESSLESWLMASWLAMAAAEVDTFEYSKYTTEQRRAARDHFYKSYLDLEVRAPPRDETELSKALGRFYEPSTRVDLLPAIALERLALHNELCELKWGEKEATKWKEQGFPLSRRISSTKRHFDGVHRRDTSEDHVAHLIWNLMAIYHVNTVFPHLNDLHSYERRDTSS